MKILSTSDAKKVREVYMYIGSLEKFTDVESKIYSSIERYFIRSKAIIDIPKILRYHGLFIGIDNE